MQILLVGEYSRLHLSLAEGLRVLGHEVTLASDGDLFKNYARDVDLTRKSSGLIDTTTSLYTVLKAFRKFKNYDVVQLINPCFTTHNVLVNRYLFRKLKKHNKKIFLGAFGDDSYWVRACMDNHTFKYSEFFVNGESTELRYNKKLEQTWIRSSRENLNREIAQGSDGIIACLYEYYMSYKSYFTDKLEYIPLPINTSKIDFQQIARTPEKVIFFIGINKDRSEYKGTDIMEEALLRLVKKYPNDVAMVRAESVDYEAYKNEMAQSHVVLDQLYSHSPSMNALLAMAQGKVLVGGGEPEIYDLLHEEENHPIVNVFPTKEDVFNKLEEIVLNKSIIPQLSRNSRLFVDKHHDYVDVAKKYVEYWSRA